MSSLKAYFTKIHEDAKLPTYATKKSVGCDLYAIEEKGLNPQTVTLIRTGIVATPPIGCYWELCFRSGISVKKPGLVLANGVGIIDPDYCGPQDEIKIAILNNSVTFHIINKGDRIAQLILREFTQPQIVEKDLKEIENKNVRGGFGSTGE